MYIHKNSFFRKPRWRVTPPAIILKKLFKRGFMVKLINYAKLLYVFLYKQQIEVPHTHKYYNNSARWCDKDEIYLILGFTSTMVKRIINETDLFTRPRNSLNTPTSLQIVQLNPSYSYLLEDYKDIDFNNLAIDRLTFADNYKHYNQRVFYHLLDNPNEDSFLSISKKLGIHINAVKNACNCLKNLGYIEIFKTEGKVHCNKFLCHLDKVAIRDKTDDFIKELRIIRERRKIQYSINKLNVERLGILDTANKTSSKAEKSALFDAAERKKREIKMLKKRMPERSAKLYYNHRLWSVKDVSVFLGFVSRTKHFLFNKVANIKREVYHDVETDKDQTFLDITDECRARKENFYSVTDDWYSLMLGWSLKW